MWPVCTASAGGSASSSSSRGLSRTAPRSCHLRTPDAAFPRALPQCSQGSDLYAVRKFTPPQEDLGSVTLPTNTQTGDSFALNERTWVVNRVATQFKLTRGKYKKDSTRLYVVETSRWLLDGFLTQLYEKQ